MVQQNVTCNQSQGGTGLLFFFLFSPRCRWKQILILFKQTGLEHADAQADRTQTKQTLQLYRCPTFWYKIVRIVFYFQLNLLYATFFHLRLAFLGGITSICYTSASHWGWWMFAKRVWLSRWRPDSVSPYPPYPHRSPWPDATEGLWHRTTWNLIHWEIAFSGVLYWRWM